jgi:hypothetical protein
MQGLSRLRLAKPSFSISGPLARICGDRGELPRPPRAAGGSRFFARGQIMIGRGAPSAELGGPAERQEASVNWAQFATIWKQLKGKIAFWRVRLSDERKIAETLKPAQTSDDQRASFRPDNREKRHEFSQHIGC